MWFWLKVSALLGRIPSAVGYQPTLATDMGTMQERITTTRKGSITSVQVSVMSACVSHAIYQCEKQVTHGKSQINILPCLLDRLSTCQLMT